MTDNRNSSDQTLEKFSFHSLTSIRKKLLDLSARNGFLNYRHPQSKCVRLVNVQPDLLVEALQEGNSLTFMPVPEPDKQALISAGLWINDSLADEKKAPFPSALQWATHIGLPNTWELAASSINSPELQSLLYPSQLEARLRHITNIAKTTIEESGANTLYLALGFLEWYESIDSDIPRLSPLYTLPVHLEKGKLDNHLSLYRYSIRLKDEQLLDNIILREKLMNDFNLQLPAIEEDMLPDTYFAQLQETILPHQPRWSIRRYASLVILDFSKLVMYQDLDPANWPAHAAISNHPIIRQFFDSTADNTNTDSSHYKSEHSIDNVPNIHEQFPLVYDADSSQHSALIDAVNGDNLVIEGPPGSGKSQTITNLIAACIGNGQKVLFVAEKMAALEVVKQRLDNAGLGDFCLELHSHKTSKIQLLQELNTRLTKQEHYQTPEAISIDIARLEDLKHKLQQYAELINSPWKKTGLSLHDILNKATRYREQLGIDPHVLTIEGINGDVLTPVKQKELIDNADILSSIYTQVSEQAFNNTISNHYWFGVGHIPLASYQPKQLSHSLQQWTDQLEQLSHYWQTQISHFYPKADSKVSLDTLQTIHNALQNMPNLIGGELLGELETIATQPDEFKQWFSDYQNIHQTLNRLSEVFKTQALDSPASATAMTSILQTIQQLGIPTSYRLSDLAKDVEEINALRLIIQNTSNPLQEIRLALPAAFAEAFLPSINGLQEFTLLIRLIEQLPRELWPYRDDRYHHTAMTELLNRLNQPFFALLTMQQTLKNSFKLDDLPEASLLTDYQEQLHNKSLLRWASSSFRQAKKALYTLSTKAKPSKKSLLAALPLLISYRQGLATIDAIHQDNPILNDWYQSIHTPLKRINILHKWYQTIRENYGNGFGERVMMGNALLKLDSQLANAILDSAQNGLTTRINAITTALKSIRLKYPNYSLLQNNYADLSTDASPLNELQQLLTEQLEALSRIVSEKSATKTLDELHQEALSLDKAHKHVHQWQQSKLTCHLVPHTLAISIEKGQFSSQAFAACQNTLRIVNSVITAPLVLHAISQQAVPERYQALQSSQAELGHLLTNVQTTFQCFVEQGHIIPELWMSASHNNIPSLITKNRQALANPSWLDTWLDYLRLKDKLTQQGLSNVISHLEAHTIPADKIADVLQLVIYHQLSTDILTEYDSLASFNGMEQVAIRQKYQEYDRKLLHLQRQKIAYKASKNEILPGVVSGKVANYTEVALIKHEAGKKSRHLAVRTLLQRAGQSIAALKPCFMMSPMSVAQYLKPGEFTFDIVIMDEASQIRPEDALGAIARGKSLVVVGDPKQLPPTSFFQKIVDNDNDDDIVALEESDSILESVIPLFKNRRLRWHYRSRHESLIAFSNKQFYDSNLILFPSPFQESDEFGLCFSKIEACFIQRRNYLEAQEIVGLIAMHLLNNPNESIGVVAMNAEQREEIENQFELFIKQSPHLATAWEHNIMSAHPLFIKNLENVQGDERDVIIISMTYGPETLNGRTMQRFGPINGPMGWRRLNVLFTRAKKRMHIVSSMSSGDILINDTSSRGLISLRAFLEYCERGHLHYTHHTGKAADSDFEIAVMNALAEHGYQCEPQLGVAGYFLDLAVKDPRKPGGFLMGIECDGATYHSAKSTRDRDRLRQDILESLGWTIKRIWSTDWFKNPQAQLYPIIQALNQMVGGE